MMCESCKIAAVELAAGNPYGRNAHELCRSLITTVGCEEGSYQERETLDPTQCTCQHRPIKPGQIQKVAK